MQKKRGLVLFPRVGPRWELKHQGGSELAGEWIAKDLVTDGILFTTDPFLIPLTVGMDQPW